MITSGKWEFEAGDNGDPSVGLPGYPPTVVMVDDEGHCIPIATGDDPIYYDPDLDSTYPVQVGSSYSNLQLMAQAKDMARMLERAYQMLEFVEEWAVSYWEDDRPNNSTKYDTLLKDIKSTLENSGWYDYKPREEYTLDKLPLPIRGSSRRLIYFAGQSILGYSITIRKYNELKILKTIKFDNRDQMNEWMRKRKGVKWA